MDSPPQSDSSGVESFYGLSEGSGSKSSISSISTNATAPNISGAGRTLGRAFDSLGRRLEARLQTIPQNSRLGGLIFKHQEHSESVYSFDTFSTNATADNLPGAGRIVGLAYGYGGRHLETYLNKVAEEKLGLGPRTLAVQIKRRSPLPDRPSSLVTVESEAERSARIKKDRRDCRRLLKYVTRSNSVTNQIQALEKIVELCTIKGGQSVRELLIAEGAATALQHLYSRIDKDLDPSLLLTNSRKALICVSEVAVNAAACILSCPDYRQLEKTNSRLLDEQLAVLINGIKWVLPYVIRLELLQEQSRNSDAEMSFLALRHLKPVFNFSQPIVLGYGSTRNKIIQAFAKLLAEPSDTREWHVVDETLGEVVPSSARATQSDIGLWNAWISLAEGVFRRADELPIIARHGCWTGFHISVTLNLIPLNGDGRTEIDGSLALARAAFPSPSLSALWNFMSMKPEIVMSQLKNERINQWNVIPASRVAHLCRQLVFCLVSQDEGVHNQTRQCILETRSLDRYCWNAVQLALCEVASDIRCPPQRFAALAGEIWHANQKPQLMPRIRPRLEWVRYCVTVDGRQAINTSESKGLFWADDNLIFKICVPSRAQPSVLEKREDDVIWLEVSHKSSFSTEGHLAVIAGVNASGEKEYIARVRGTDDKPRGFCCTVTEGATSVRYVDQSGQVRTSTCFEVAVLRYDPYFSEKTPRPPTGSDGTGHLHWRKLSARERMTYDMQIPVWSSMR